MGAVQTVQTAPVVKSVSTPLVYNTVPVAHSVVPATYTHHVAAPAVLPVATVHKAADHGVAATYAGLVHSSHVGIASTTRDNKSNAKCSNLSSKYFLPVQ